MKATLTRQEIADACLAALRARGVVIDPRGRWDIDVTPSKRGREDEITFSVDVISPVTITGEV
jgi:hypothetical protein